MKNKAKDIELFKNGIFNLGTNFGELSQSMIQELENFSPADGKHFDLLDSERNKIEVKFSRARKKIKPLKDTNIIDYCKNFSSNSRILLESEAENNSFDCNIQQIKPSEFDILYYGIFFKDKIMIFRTESENVSKMPGYSIQHKNGSEYQFHIKKTNYSYHKNNHLYKELLYTDLFNLFQK